MNLSSLLIPPASAHKIETAEDVGATLHIEPNDTPRAGETALTWFALTRKGGKIIPLKECDCQLAIYSEPRETTATPVAKPNLEPVSAERYQGIPGTNITFPKPGAYQLEFSGRPANGDSFKPFELKFDITVAAGNKKAATNQPKAIEKIEKKESQEIQNVNASQNQEQGFSLPFWTIGLVALVILGGIFAFTRRTKD